MKTNTLKLCAALTIASLISSATATELTLYPSFAEVRENVQLSGSRFDWTPPADLGDYPDDSFDVVILSDTLQAMLQPDAVLAQMLRIGRRAVISLPNFGHWRVRLALLLSAVWRFKENLGRVLDDTEPRLGDAVPMAGRDESVVVAAFMGRRLSAI